MCFSSLNIFDNSNCWPNYTDVTDRVFTERTLMKKKVYKYSSFCSYNIAAKKKKTKKQKQKINTRNKILFFSREEESVIIAMSHYYYYCHFENIP